MNYFEDHLDDVYLRVMNRQTEIEQEDEDRCNNCGGEDCACCEYYHDRQLWKTPTELFNDN